MTPERHSQIGQLFHQVLELEPNRRAEFLRETCHHDPALRREVEALLASHEDAGDFINAPAVEVLAQEIAESESSVSPRPRGNLETGAIVGPYEVLAPIGAGGMGEVFLCRDTRLSRKIALKVLHGQLTTEADRMGRFHQEARAVSALNHPNIVTIYEVGQEGGLHFIAYEFIEGETLRQRLTRPMTIAEALDVASQIASGLEAAHAAGVIHRDLKPENIMVRGDGFVKVLDFGLAKLSEIHNDTQGPTVDDAHTAPGVVMGTFRYMSPEQARGQKTDARTDIFSLAVVLYEMVTGHQPFDGQTMSDVIAAILVKDPPPLAEHVKDVPEELQRIVGKALAKNPDDRYPTVKDLLLDLKTLKRDYETGWVSPRPRAVSTSAAKSKPRGRHYRRVAGVAGVLLVLGALAGMFATRYSQTQAPPRRSVAVLGFKNLTGAPDAAWLATALSEMLTTELSAGEKLRTVPGESVARMKVELSLPESSSFAPDTLAKIRRYLGADVVVVGSYLADASPTRVRLDLRLQDLTNGELLATIGDEDLATDLVELVERTGSALREKLAVAPGQNELELARAAHPANSKAARYYAEGIEKLRVYDALGARAVLEEAVNADPGNALARAALATSWSMQGYGVKAREESRKARELAARLSRENQLVVEGRYSEAAQEWAEAAEVYRTLFGFFPDNVDYGLRLAGAQTSAGKPQDAMATVVLLRKLPALDGGNDGSNPGIDLAEARAAGALSDFKLQQTLASGAAARGRSMDARLLVAGARLLEGNALASLGSFEAARQALEESRNMYAATGDAWAAASAATNLGVVLANSGDPAGATKIYADSLALYNKLGDRRSAAATLIAMASIARNQADLAGAKRMQEQALAIFRETEDRAGEAKALNNIGNLFAVSRDSSGAKKMYESALRIFRDIGDRNGVATVLGNSADLMTEAGELSRATSLLEESLKAFRELGNKASIAYGLSRVADLLVIQNDLAEARNKHEEALSLRTEIGDKGGMADSRLLLAQIALLEGGAEEAEQSVQQAIPQFRSERRTDDEASALAVLARALLAQGKSSEAEKTSNRAEELSRNSKNASLRLSVAITTASIRALTGEAAKAATDLDRVVSEANRSGLIGIAFEARLALGQIEITGGRPDSARSGLVELQKRSVDKGI